MFKSKKTLVLCVFLLVCIAITIFFIFKNSNNDRTFVTSISEVKILDKYKDDNTYYWKIDLYDEFVKTSRYDYLDDTVRTFKVDPKLYNSVDSEQADGLLGLLISFSINKRHPLYNDELFKQEPFIHLLDPAFNDFNEIVKVFE